MDVIRNMSPRTKKAVILTALILIGGILILSGLQLRDQLGRAKAMKNNVQNMVSCIMNQNYDGAEYSLSELKKTSAEVQDSLNTPFWKVAAHVPGLKNEFHSIRELLNMLDTAADKLLAPGITVLREHPMNGGEASIQAYLAFLDSSLPTISDMVSTASSLDLGLLNLGFNVSGILDSVNRLTSMAGHSSADLLASFTELSRQYPLSGLKNGNQYNIRSIGKYLEFIESNLPLIRAALEELHSNPMQQVLKSEKIQKYAGIAESLLELYDENTDVVDMIRTAITRDDNRAYLLVAMNSTEIRSLGGFPGSVCAIQIRDGMLTMGDFTSVYNIFTTATPASAKLTNEEIHLFTSQVGGISITWDACFCPDFERVAQIWAASYADRYGLPVDGIAAMTPEIIQKVLGVCGAEFTLSDGTQLDSTNATKVLGHDIYFRYFGKEYIENANGITDNLFAETAKQALSAAVDSLSADTLPDYLRIAEESFRERTAMVWMREESAEETIRQHGWSGGLSKDPMNPQIGIYFNCIIACKMGWFTQIDTEIGDPTVNEDGSRTYPVQITLTNVITQEEINTAGNVYILGGGLGSFDCSLYLFAPAGGTIDHFSTNSTSSVQAKSYNEYSVGYMNYARLHPNTPLVIKCQVTTAPGAEAPLTINQTPTLQAYH